MSTHGLASFVSALLFLAVAQPSLPGQDAESCTEVLREFKRFYPKMRKVEERLEAIRTLEAADCPAAVSVLVKFLRDRRPQVVGVAKEVLLQFAEPESVVAIRAAMQDASAPAVQAYLITILTGLEDRAALPLIVEVSFGSKSSRPEVKFRAAQALGKLGDASYAKVLSAALSESDDLVRMAATESVGKLKLAGLHAEVLELIEDHSWQVAIAAVRSLGLLRDAESIDPLIALMRKGGRIQEECAESLFRITGMEIGLFPDIWQQVMATLRQGTWRIPTDAELAKAAASRNRYQALYSKHEGNNAFGGIKTSSQRLLFIIDVSGSMEDEVVNRTNFDAEYPNFRKLTIVKTELARTIENLESSTRFNIVAFASDLHPWKKGLVPANVVNRASAAAWVARLQVMGGSASQSLAAAGLGGSASLALGRTNTYKALMHAFGFDPDKPRKNHVPNSKSVQRNPVDTVFFLSDGRPSTGKVVDQGEILAAVQHRNESYRLVINCIAIGEFQKTFLKTLAEMTGGVFVDLGQ